MDNLTPSERRIRLLDLLRQARARGTNFVPVTKVDNLLLDQQPATFLRHDIHHVVPSKLLEFARHEVEMGVIGTYFFMSFGHPSGAKYFSAEDQVIMMQEVAELGHEIGAHFDPLYDTRHHGKSLADALTEQLDSFGKVIGDVTVAPPKRAMRIAQQLYEGITLGRGKNAEGVGLITYMRTDSVRLSPDAVNDCRAYIGKKYGKDSVPEKPNVFKTKNQNVQDAHEAIRPTQLDLPPEAVSKYLTDPQRRLYKLIWDRFVASQMTPAVFDQTGVEIEATADGRTYGLRASGSVLKVPGWRAVYGAATEPLAGEEPSPEDRTDDDDSLPELNEGEGLHLVIPPGAESHHKQTEPLPLFTEATLVKKLEEEGIGRPSTYAEIISKVEQRSYVEKDGNKLVPTPIGTLVVEKLVAGNFDLADIGFTRKLEEDLDAVGEARAKRLDVLQPFHDRLQAQIAHAVEDKGKWWPEPVETGEECPESGDPLVKRWGRNGPFIGCTKYPECRYTLNIGRDGEVEPPKEPELTDYDCHECGAKMTKRWGRNGWFLGCSKYPACKHTRAVPLGYKCPKCKTGDIVPIKAKGRGRPFYGCTNYRSDEPCDFRSWQKPIGIKCPTCGTDFLVAMGGKKSPKLKCVNETCDFERPYDPSELPDENASDEASAAAESAAG